MSVFTDFQLAWAQRFPGCELPKAWEDDVRANFAKHKHKVALLKEELEKEEFYVEYLEKLLADVSRVKSGTESSTNDDAPLSHSEETISVKSSSHVPREGHQDQYVTVISVSSYGEIQKPNVDNKSKNLIDNPLYQDAQALSLDVASKSALSDIKGINSNVLPSDKQLQDKKLGSDQIGKDNKAYIKKKRPPTPPRKPKINHSILPLHIERRDTFSSISAPNTPDSDCSDKIVKSNSTSLMTVGQTNSQTNPKEEKRECEAVNHDQNSFDKLTSIKLENNKMNLYEFNNEKFEEEDIYDTVAPDEPDEKTNSVAVDLVKSDNIELNSSNSNLSSKYDYSPYANYVNIDYFLRKEETSSRDDSDDNETHFSHSLSSEHDAEERRESIDSREHDNYNLDENVQILKNNKIVNYDEVFESDDGVYSSTDLSKTENEEKSEEINKREAERLAMYKCIISSIIESESIYVDCLYILIKYKKALNSTIGTPHPLLTLDDLNTIFYKIQEIYDIHCVFLDGMKKLPLINDNSQNNSSIGDLFKTLASRLGAYSSFLKNYSKALEAVQRCNAANNQFSQITRSIKPTSLKGQATSLEDLLHKPVARVQKNALVLHDLLKYTSEDNAEYKSLSSALKMTQCFLNDLNIAATQEMFPTQDRTQRRLVKESFIIESIEGKRKLRHLFLFNDVIVCAKYKPSTRQKFTFELKWYVLLNELSVAESENDSMCGKDNSSEILSLKSRLSNTRDQILKEEKEKNKANSKLLEKLRKKQSEMEAQLVLLLPQLIFPIVHKSGKTYIFHLSSEFEKAQWIEAIKVLQQSANFSGETINFNELQAWIETCRKNLNPNLGSFLLRSSRDEDLLYGDLYVTVNHLKGLSRKADIFFAFELDTYGHFFQRAITKISKQSLEPRFNQEFVLDLDGTLHLRIICYEEVTGHSKPLLRGKTSLELSRSWLSDKEIEHQVGILQDCNLSLTFRFISFDSITSAFPAAKVCGTFGLNVHQVCKKEKSNIPYLISSCVRQVERRGMKEVGIYRVSGLSTDVQKLKKAFETNTYEAELLLKEIDIHAITGLLKLYLRELPESLFTSSMYKKYFDAFNMQNQIERNKQLLSLFSQLCQPNQAIIIFLIDHLFKINQYESYNKMSLHNLATVFGPSLLRPGGSNSSSNSSDTFTSGTYDVMAQAGILHFFLKRRSSGLSLTNLSTETPC